MASPVNIGVMAAGVEIGVEFLNTVSDPPPRRRLYAVTNFSHRLLENALAEIREGKKNGSITINFSRGVPSGTVEWKEQEER